MLQHRTQWNKPYQNKHNVQNQIWFAFPQHPKTTQFIRMVHRSLQHQVPNLQLPVVRSGFWYPWGRQSNKTYWPNPVVFCLHLYSCSVVPQYLYLVQLQYFSKPMDIYVMIFGFRGEPPEVKHQPEPPIFQHPLTDHMGQTKKTPKNFLEFSNPAPGFFYISFFFSFWNRFKPKSINDSSFS